MIMKQKALIIGLDGATFDIIDPLAKEGWLPNLAKIMADGVRGVLRSTMPPTTCPAWNAFLTGKNPGKLGFYGFFNFDPETRRYEMSSWRQHGRDVCDILTEHGKRIGLVNVPLTYPPKKVNGFIVSGMGTPSEKSDYTYPAHLKNELKELVGHYEGDVRKARMLSPEALVREVKAILEKRSKTTQYLLKKYDWDLFITVFTETDRLQHFVWNYLDPNRPEYASAELGQEVKGIYQTLDRIVGDLISEVGNEAPVFIVSDHGFTGVEKTFYINRWLEEQGLLKLKTNLKSRLSKLGVNEKTLFLFFKRLGLDKFIAHITPAKIKKMVPTENLFLKDMDIDWQKSSAYSVMPFGIYLNRQSLAPDQIEQTKQDLRQKLIQMAETNSLSINFFEREQLFSGPYVKKAPDIIFILDEHRCHVDPSFSEKTFDDKSHWQGDHDSNGILIARGPGIKRNDKVEDAEITDIIPTALHVLQVPIPDDIDGKILFEIFSDDSSYRKMAAAYETTEENKERESGHYTDEEEELMKKRLRDLGYL